MEEIPHLIITANKRQTAIKENKTQSKHSPIYNPPGQLDTASVWSPFVSVATATPFYHLLFTCPAWGARALPCQVREREKEGERIRERNRENRRERDEESERALWEPTLSASRAHSCRVREAPPRFGGTCPNTEFTSFTMSQQTPAPISRLRHQVSAQCSLPESNTIHASFIPS